MTLLKAYLVNTDNPFLMLKYYLESIDKIEKANIKQMKNIFKDIDERSVFSNKVGDILYGQKDKKGKSTYVGSKKDLTSKQTKNIDELSNQLKQFFKNNPKLKDTSLGKKELFERVKSDNRTSLTNRDEADFKNELRNIKFTVDNLIDSPMLQYKNVEVDKKYLRNISKLFDDLITSFTFGKTSSKRGQRRTSQQENITLNQMLSDILELKSLISETGMDLYDTDLERYNPRLVALIESLTDSRIYNRLKTITEIKNLKPTERKIKSELELAPSKPYPKISRIGDVDRGMSNMFIAITQLGNSIRRLELASPEQLKRIKEKLTDVVTGADGKAAKRKPIRVLQDTIRQQREIQDKKELQKIVDELSNLSTEQKETKEFLDAFSDIDMDELSNEQKEDIEQAGDELKEIEGKIFGLKNKWIQYKDSVAKEVLEAAPDEVKEILTVSEVSEEQPERRDSSEILDRFRERTTGE